MEGKKVVWAVIAIAIIVVAIIFTVRRAGGPDIDRPAELTGKMVEKIDAMSGELITETAGEWEKLDYNHMGRVWENPDTGEYTVVELIVCPHCGTKIPGRLESLEEIMDPATMEPEARVEADQAYACPNCGECPYLPPPPVLE